MFGFEEIISRLRVDSNNSDFTGFVTNAYVVDSTLRGEVWRHLRAEPSGLFADGHRIETSRIIDIEARGDSVWFDTESGSRYGIISFSPIGLINLSKLRDADGFLVWPPKEKRSDAPKGILKKSGPINSLMARRAARLQQSPKQGPPLRPETDPNALQHYKELFEKRLGEIKRYDEEYEELVKAGKVPVADSTSDVSEIGLDEKYHSTFKQFNEASSIRECGLGWLKIVESFCSLLYEYNERDGSEKTLIRSIIGKFGSLHILISGKNPEILQWANFAERHSTRTCEICGGAGRLIYDAGWQRTRCDAHRTQSVEPSGWGRVQVNPLEA